MLTVIAREPVGHLREFLAQRQAGVLQAHDVVYVLKTAAREILPGTGFAGRCAQLGLFSDWVVHDEIDRSPVGQAAIAAIAEAIPSTATMSSTTRNGWRRW